jgi:hypothetical protein
MEEDVTLDTYDYVTSDDHVSDVKDYVSDDE